MDKYLRDPKKNYYVEDSAKKLSSPVLIENPNYHSANKLTGKNALITGGDSGIGASVAIAFALEGANVGIVYHSNDDDAKQVINRLDEIGVETFLYKGDIGKESEVKECLKKFINKFKKIDVLVNNVAEQHEQDKISNISNKEIEREFATNIYSYINFCKYAFPHFSTGASIINTTSVNAYRGHPELLIYSTTKSAIVGLTRSLSIRKEFIDNKIRVNCVAPGPIWTPLIPATMKDMEHDDFGLDTPMKRCGEAFEVAPSFVFLASNDDSSYITGQCIHVNGGAVING